MDEDTSCWWPTEVPEPPPLPEGTWRGYYVYPKAGERTVCWMTLQLQRLDQQFLGRCVDDSGDAAEITAGTHDGDRRRLRWSKRYVCDGWPCVYRGEFREDGSIAGEWSFDEPWQIEQMRRVGGPLRGSFCIWRVRAGE